MKEDSIDGIYDTLKHCALISQSAGGIGLSIHDVRATGSYIKGTNGTSNGIVPMLRVFNDTARYVDQGGGKRKGSFAIYMEPWHADIFDFLDLKKNHGKEEKRARDLFYALWIPDLFMKRVEATTPGRCSVRTSAPACPIRRERSLRNCTRSTNGRQRPQNHQGAGSVVCHSGISDRNGHALHAVQGHANRKSNQKNLGTIKSSNLCTEIMEYTAPDEVAVCNLASIALPKFVEKAQDGLPVQPPETIRNHQGGDA